MLITNEIDLILQAAVTRFPPPDDRDMLLGSSSPGGFKVATNGTPTPASIVFSPILFGMPASTPVSYVTSGGLALTYSGNEATLGYTDMGANTGTVEAAVTYEGITYRRSIIVNKVFDGAKGDTGAPGMDGAQSLVKPIWHSDWMGGAVVSVTGPVGPQARRGYANDTVVSSLVAKDNTRVYRTRFWARASADANGVLYQCLQQFVNNSGTAGPDNSGRAPYKPGGAAPHTDWKEYSYTWSSADWQAGVTHVRPYLLLNYRDSLAGNVGYWEVQDYSFADVTEAYNAQQAAQAYAEAKAYLTRIQAEAYADGIVTAEEERAIADATNKAGAARVAAVNAAAADATAKANAAQAAATAAAATAAQAMADLAQTTAMAHADGIVTAEEERAIADATAKANAAQAAAVAAAAADATAKANAAVSTAAAAAQAKADLAETQAKAYADGIVTAEEERAISDATAKAEVARAAAINAAAIDAQTKADAAANWAVSTANAYAQAQAALARTNAEAHADGVVTAAEQRAIADATAKADAARVAAVNAAAADATAKANVAATMAQWPSIGGAGKPADNASSDISIIARNTQLTISGNTIVKTGGVNGWGECDACSQNGFIGGAFVSAIAPNTTSVLMFGLNRDAHTDAGSWQTLDFAFYIEYGNLFIYESNVQVADLGPFTAGALLAISYDGVNVRYVRNELLVRTVAAAITEPLFFDSAFNNIGARLNGIRFFQMSSSAWLNVGGAGKPQDNATVGAPAGTPVADTDAATVAQTVNDINSPFSISLAGTLATSVAAGGPRTYGTMTATLTGGIGTVDLLWEAFVTWTDAAQPVSVQLSLTGNNLSRGVAGTAPNGATVSYTIKVTASDSKRTRTATFSTSTAHGMIQ